MESGLCLGGRARGVYIRAGLVRTGAGSSQCQCQRKRAKNPSWVGHRDSIREWRIRANGSRGLRCDGGKQNSAWAERLEAGAGIVPASSKAAPLPAGDDLLCLSGNQQLSQVGFGAPNAITYPFFNIAGFGTVPTWALPPLSSSGVATWHVFARPGISTLSTWSASAACADPPFAYLGRMRWAGRWLVTPSARAAQRLQSVSPMSSFQSCGRASIKARINSMHSGSWAISS
jgi:hypothetical protein